MGGISVAHGEDRVPSPIHESPESLQLQKRGNNNDDLPCRHHSARRGTPTYPLTAVIGWGLDIRAAPPWEDIMSGARFRNPGKPGTITEFSRESTQPRMMVRQSSIHIGLSLIGCAARRARDTRGGDRPANGGGGAPTHPMRTGLHRRCRNPSIPHHSNKPGTKTDFSRVDTTPHGVEALAS